MPRLPSFISVPTALWVRRYIYKLPVGELFTTRDLLGFGSRRAIDATTHRMVKTKKIVRVARGVFYRVERHERNQPPRIYTAYEVAAVKAAAFGKRIMIHPVSAAHMMEFTNKGNCCLIFSTSGCSSSFTLGSTRIIFKGTCARKMQLGDSLVGLLAKAIWSLGPKHRDPEAFQPSLKRLKRKHRQQLCELRSLMPAWALDLTR